MADFIEQQWTGYQSRIKETLEYLADGDSGLTSRFQQELDQWMPAEAPGSYPELLERIAAGGELVIKWQEDSPRELASEPGQSGSS